MSYIKDKNETLILRMSVEQKAILNCEANKLNVSVSELIRRQILSGIIPSKHKHAKLKKEKDEAIMVRLSSEQKDLLKNEANRLNISVSELTRRQLINGLIPEYYENY